jgi:hypothetical protein
MAGAAASLSPFNKVKLQRGRRLRAGARMLFVHSDGQLEEATR